MSIDQWWFTLRLRLRSLLQRRRLDREIDEELQFQLAHTIDEGLARGLSPQQAREAALRAMGGLAQRAEEMRDMRRVHWLTDFIDDIHYAIRTLRRTAGLTSFIVITLALGIGMASAMFSMVDALIFRPYPVPHPGNIVTLVSTSRDRNVDDFSYREYLDIRNHTSAYEGVIASSIMQAVGFSAEPKVTPRIKGAMLVSGNYFHVLGVEPIFGRVIGDEDDRVPGRDAVAVLGPDFWKHEFGSDPSVVGRTIRLNGAEFTVIGILPESFPGLPIFARPDVYVPLAMARTFSTNPRKNFFEDRDDRELGVKARLRSDTTLEQAQSELVVLAQHFARDYPQLNRDRGAAVRTPFQMRTRDDDENWKFSVIFAILAMAVLLVACTNVAGLLLSRGRTRTREIAVRLALGAGRFRLIRLLLTETLILAILGGLASVVVGYAGISFLQTFSIPTELPVTIPFRLDTRVLIASLALSLSSVLLCGLAPALQSARTDLLTGLKTADVDVPGRKRLWGRQLLVIAQVATSLMLLTASFLMVRGFQRTLLDGVIVARDHLLMMRFDPRLVQYDGGQTQRFYQRLIERVREANGVRGAAFTQNPPLGFDEFEALAFVPDDVTMPRERQNFTSAMDTVDEGYFTTLRIPILRGRAFLATDTADTPRVAIVNDHFARHYWPDGDAIGKHLQLDRRGGPPIEIVGVAQTIKYRDTADKPMDFVYLPLTQHPIPRMVLMVRTTTEPLQLASSMQDIVRSFDPNMPVSEIRTYEDLYNYSAVEGPGIAIEMVSAMGAIGLLLAIAGLYGLIAYGVSRRTREIGIRIALGASPFDVVRLVMTTGITLVAIGTIIGLAMGFGVEQLMNAMLFNAGGVDVVAYVVVVPALFVVTLLAAYAPARRAARIAPTQALRYE